jgi:hypothetical protein
LIKTRLRFAVRNNHCIDRRTSNAQHSLQTFAQERDPMLDVGDPLLLIADLTLDA